MFENYVGAKHKKRPKWVGLLIAVSVAVHAVAGAAMVIQSIWVINKLTGLDKTVATEALKNASPDPAIHRSQTLAIAAMMRDLKYISKDVSAEAEKNMDYSFLEKATGKAKNDLGY